MLTSIDKYDRDTIIFIAVGLRGKLDEYMIIRWLVYSQKGDPLGRVKLWKQAESNIAHSMIRIFKSSHLMISGSWSLHYYLTKARNQLDIGSVTHRQVARIVPDTAPVGPPRRYHKADTPFAMEPTGQ